MSTTADSGWSQRSAETAPDPEAYPWAVDSEAVARAFGCAVAHGLSEPEVGSRRRIHGPNELAAARPRSPWTILLDQFQSLVVWLLVVAALAAFALNESVDGAAILMVLLFNGAIGFITEFRAVRSMEALRDLGATSAKVRRSGAVKEILAAEVVPGDVLLFEAGDVVGADVRLVDAAALEVDESALTGESLPVSKEEDRVPMVAPLAERRSMLYRGTAVAHGTGEGLVVATGMATEIGAISRLAAADRESRSPLEKDIETLGRQLALLCIVLAGGVAIAALLHGHSGVFAVQLGVALAVATIPEGLPVVVTVALARSMARMARRNALVENLTAVETLGATSVLMTDKTGTLTENRMTMVGVQWPGGEARISGVGLDPVGQFENGGGRLEPSDHWGLLETLKVCVLCNDASLSDPAEGERVAVGDPTEVALLVGGLKGGWSVDDLLVSSPRVDEVPFGSRHKRMATFHRDGERIFVAIKGAPEAIIPICGGLAHASTPEALSPSTRSDWLARAEAAAERGERVLGIARKLCSSADEFEFAGLELLGLVTLSDPPRESARDAIEAFHVAGVRTIMVTGDHQATGLAIARAVGIPPEDVVGRATPKGKLDLIGRYQGAGEVVGMIGDGVNDAPALKHADIGIAMGVRGTQVAREAADIVLTDDRLESVVVAIREGRAVFNNVRRFVVYLLSCNTSEAMLASAASVMSGPLPILPLHILFLNMVTDIFPAVALGVSEGSPVAMERPPRSRGESLLHMRTWGRIGVHGLMIFASVMGALWMARTWLELSGPRVTTVAFLTLAMAQLWHVFTMRVAAAHRTHNEVTRNPWIWAALALSFALLVVAVTAPGVAAWLRLENPGLLGWGLAMVASVLPLVAAELLPRSVTWE